MSSLIPSPRIFPRGFSRGPIAIALLMLLPVGAMLQAAAKPNIVYIMADDLGYGELGCYGQTKIKTPNLDRMAAEGTRFTDVYSGAPVCAPCRCVLMTGKHTGHAFVRSNGGDYNLPRSEVTVAEVLHGAGYTNGFVGKWSLGDVGSASTPLKRGFDYAFGFYNQGAAHRQYPQTMDENDQAIVLPENAGGKRGAYAHDLMTGRSFDFIRRSKDRPFFLYLAYTLPHAEILVPEDSLAEYRGKFPEKPFENKGAGYASQPEPNAAVAGMISRLDRDVGRLLALLKELRLEENTIVFFTSDNGPVSVGGRDYEFFHGAGPLRGRKGGLYDGGIREPMIVRWPGHVPAGKTSDVPWYFADVLPTLAELGGGKLPAGIDGVSVLPTLLGREQPALRNRFMYWEYPAGGFRQAARRGDWKVQRSGLDGPLELYNLRDDIGEKKNVAAAHPDIVAQFNAYLKTARVESAEYPSSGDRSKKNKKEGRKK
ncbi:MAG: arylsulfatase [Opitutaceae bacterium]|nr:arylsulfatase [Opitutaceae bacterium]